MSRSGGTAPEPRRLYTAMWEDCTGMATAYIAEMAPDGYYPAMVRLEFECDTSTFTVADARDLANHILAAADMANHANAEAFRRTTKTALRPSSPESNEEMEP